MSSRKGIFPRKIIIIGSTAEPSSAKFFKIFLILLSYLYIAFYDPARLIPDTPLNIAFLSWLILYAVFFIFFRKISLDTKIFFIVFPALLFFAANFVERQIYTIEFSLFNYFFAIFLLMAVYQIINFNYVKIGIKLILLIGSVASLLVFIRGIRVSASQSMLVHYKIIPFDYALNPFYLVANVYMPVLIIVFLYELLRLVFAGRWHSCMFALLHFTIIVLVAAYCILVLHVNQMSSIVSWFIPPRITEPTEISVNTAYVKAGVRKVDMCCENEQITRMGPAEISRMERSVTNAFSPQVITGQTIGFISSRGVETAERDGRFRQLLYESARVQDVSFISSGTFVIVEDSELFLIDDDKKQKIDTSPLSVSSVEAQAAEQIIYFVGHDPSTGEYAVYRLSLENKQSEKLFSGGYYIFLRGNTIFYTTWNPEQNIYGFSRYDLFTREIQKIFERSDISVYYPCVSPDATYAAFCTREKQKVEIQLLDLSFKNISSLSMAIDPAFRPFCFDGDAALLISDNTDNLYSARISLKKQKVFSINAEEREQIFKSVCAEWYNAVTVVNRTNTGIEIMYTAAEASYDSIVTQALCIIYAARAAFFENERNFTVRTALYNHRIEITVHSSAVNSIADFSRGDRLMEKFSVAFDGKELKIPIIAY